LADAQTRQYTLRSLDCIDRAVAAMRATLQDQQQDSLARISLLQLPPSSDAAVRHYFAQRATEWRNDPDPEGQQRAALRNCIAFIGAHTAHVAAHGDLLVIDDPELLKQFQQLMAPLSGPKRPP
jgi:hypothetical protein